MTGGTKPAADLTALQDRIGYRFSSCDLLQEALTHSSLTPPASAPAKKEGKKSPQARMQDGVGSGHGHGHGHGHGRANYERLEFLGDRVLGLVVAHLLLQEFPDESEGDLARRQAALVHEGALASVARGLGLGDSIFLSEAEKRAGGADKDVILADVLEALVGAIYLDGGFAEAAGVVLRLWRPLLTVQPLPPVDAKTCLQEWAQGQGKPLPRYRVLERKGPDHDPVFVVEVSVEGMTPATGAGHSKRAAEKEAAARLLEMAGVTDHDRS